MHDDTKEYSTGIMLMYFFGSTKSANEFLPKAPQIDADLPLMSTALVFKTKKDAFDENTESEVNRCELF